MVRSVRVLFAGESWMTHSIHVEGFDSFEMSSYHDGGAEMIAALRAGEIDVGIGLTEGWIAGLGKEDIEGDGGYRLVGTYVETPLCTSRPPSRGTLSS